MTETSVDTLTCSVAGETSSATTPTSQGTFGRVVSRFNNNISYNTGSYNADPILNTDNSVVYSLQAIYTFNSDALIVEATV